MSGWAGRARLVASVADPVLRATIAARIAHDDAGWWLHATGPSADHGGLSLHPELARREPVPTLRPAAVRTAAVALRCRCIAQRRRGAVGRRVAAALQHR